MSSWNGELRNYSINYALGAYLARTYGGAALFRDVVQNGLDGSDALEDALSAQGFDLLFGEVLADWAAANLLSDDVGASDPHRYNAGSWRESTAGGEVYRLGSINLFNYTEGFQVGPFLYTVDEYAAIGSQPGHSNFYIDLGSASGVVGLYLEPVAGNTITVVVKGN